MKVLPFPCTRPAPEHVADVASLPYDVFDRAEAREYVKGRPRSFLNIDRPETQFAPDADMYAPEVYAKAAELLGERIDDGTFVEDRNRCFYIYELTWRGSTQTGVVGVCSVDEYDDGTIRRHELTRAEKERDRIEHIRATGCQTGPIFLTYRDQPVLDMIVGAAKGGTPLFDVLETDPNGEEVRQRVWEIARTESVEAINAMFATIPCAYIADGHHRCASAVRIAHEMREQAEAAGTYTGKEPFNYFLAALFPASQLSILPYNRVVADRAGMDAEELVRRISEAGFTVTAERGALWPSGAGEFGMYTDGRWYRISVGGELRKKIAARGQADPASALDTSILQNSVLGPILGIGDVRTDERISFVGGIRGTGELERRAGNGGVAFTMFPTGVDQLMAVADAGQLMPPKSTWFEPKLRSGLFIHRIAKREK